MTETNVIENDKQLGKLEPENEAVEVVMPVAEVIEAKAEAVTEVVETKVEKPRDEFKFDFDNLNIMPDCKAFPD